MREIFTHEADTLFFYLYVLKDAKELFLLKLSKLLFHILISSGGFMLMVSTTA